MKTIIKITLCFILLSTLNISASIKNDLNLNLVDQMSQDKNVQTYVLSMVKHNIFNKMISASNINKLSSNERDEYIKSMNKIIQIGNESQLKMLWDYPLLKEMTVSEREKLFDGILKTKTMAVNISGLFACIAAAITATAATLGAGQLAYKRYLYLACLATSTTAQLAALSTLGGPVVIAVLDTGVEAEIVEAEAVVCAEISFETSLSSIVAALSALSGSISACVVTNG